MNLLLHGDVDRKPEASWAKRKPARATVAVVRVIADDRACRKGSEGVRKLYLGKIRSLSSSV